MKYGVGEEKSVKQSQVKVLRFDRFCVLTDTLSLKLFSFDKYLETKVSRASGV